MATSVSLVWLPHTTVSRLPSGWSMTAWQPCSPPAPWKPRSLVTLPGVSPAKATVYSPARSARSFTTTYSRSNAHSSPWAPPISTSSFSTLVSPAAAPAVTRYSAPYWSLVTSRPSGRWHRHTHDPWVSFGTVYSSSALNPGSTFRLPAGLAAASVRGFSGGFGCFFCLALGAGSWATRPAAAASSPRRARRVMRTSEGRAGRGSRVFVAPTGRPRVARGGGFAQPLARGRTPAGLIGPGARWPSSPPGVKPLATRGRPVGATKPQPLPRCAP